MISIDVFIYLDKKENPEIYVLNLIELASAIKIDPLETLNKMGSNTLEPMSGGWKWTKNFKALKIL